MPKFPTARIIGNPKVGHESFTFVTTAATKTFAARPAGALYLQADQDCWLRFDGTAATAAAPCLKIVKNVLYGPFPFSVASFSILRDSADGTLITIYDKE